MTHLLVKGWMLAAVLSQAFAITTEVLEPQDTTAALDPTGTSFAPVPTSLISSPTVIVSTPAATATHHHWTYIPRPLPSRKPCRPRSSSAIPSSQATPASSHLIPSSSPVRTPSVIPSSSPVRTFPTATTPTPSSRPIRTPSPNTEPHWTYISRPLPDRSCSLGASSSAVIPSSRPVLSTLVIPSSRPVHTTPAVPTPTAGETPSSHPTGGPQQDTTTSSTSAAPELTTSTVLSTRTATITACPTAVPDCPASARTTSVTTETILVSTTICPVTEIAGTTQTLSPSVTSPGGLDEDAELTTSTVFTTRTATITACPSSVPNCPARSKTTSITTETIMAYTTICPVAEAEATGTHGYGVTTTQHAPVLTATEAVADGDSAELTTSTILSTQIVTITACPASVTDCPARSKTAQLATETLVVGTTAYPVTKQQQPTGSGSAGDDLPSVTTSSVLSTRVATVTACAADSNCHADSSNGAYITTETMVVGTSVFPVASTQTSEADAGLDTKTITVDSCSNDGTCTGYISTITLSGSEFVQSAPTATASIDIPSNNSGSALGTNEISAITSAPVIPPSSRPSGLSTSVVPSSAVSGPGSSTAAAPGALFTGAASSNLNIQQMMLKMLGGAVAVLLTPMLV